MKVHKYMYFRRWLEIPISGTLDICMLSKLKFGLDVIDPSTKFIQCKAIYRNCLKNSKHEDPQVIHEMASHTNIQYDRFNSTREIVISMRSDKQDKIKNNLTSQGFIVSFLWNNALKQAAKLLSHFRQTFDKVFFVNLSLSALGFYDSSCLSFTDMLKHLTL